MAFQDQLNSIFVAEDQIPESYRLFIELNQREYLSNGEMCPWDGELHTVLSPVVYGPPRA